MRAVVVVGSFLVLVGACVDGPGIPRDVSGSIDGAVYVTGPATGAVVAAYALDLQTGERSQLVGQSEPTLEDGRFHLDVGNHLGPVLLVARGVGATYVEPASGISVAWDLSTELRAVFVAMTRARDLTFNFERGGHAEVLITPFSELAVAYADARATSGRSATRLDALRVAHFLLRDHLEEDFWAAAPADVTAPVGGWNATTQAGLELAGLSQLASRMAAESSITPSGLTTLQLLTSLRRDLSDQKAQLDGQDAGGQMSLGTCSSVCRLSSKTLRANFAEAIASFLGSSANASGIGVTDAEALLTRLASRESELFPDPGSSSFDTEPPTITVDGVEEDEVVQGTVTARITVFDSIRMGEVDLQFLRQGLPVEAADFYEATPTSPNAQTRVVDLSVATGTLNDGPLTFHIDAVDQAGNKAGRDVFVFLDNAPPGHLGGTVVLGGRLVGARVRAFEYEGATQGAYGVERRLPPLSARLPRALAGRSADLPARGATSHLGSDALLHGVHADELAIGLRQRGADDLAVVARS